jgi:anti-sigma factor RsiW
MTVDRDVIQDLLPLYLAGEASPATRKLVEEHLAANPELALLARAAGNPDLAGGVGAPAPLPPLPPLPPDAQKSALDATRRLLRRRSWLMGGAIFTTLLPFSVHGDDSGIRFFLLRDAPGSAALSFSAAALLWFAYWRVARRLRVSGL